MARKILGAVIFPVCGLLLLSFLVTSIDGIVNHGNTIGSIYCLTVILLYIFYPKLKKKKPLRVISKALGWILTAAAVYSLVVVAFIISGTANTPQKAAAAGTFGAGEPQTVIILGSQVINGEPSLMLKSRLDKGIEYLNENPAAVCIVTGGQGGNETEPEGRVMRRYLIANGINGNRIYSEETSTNTRANIANAKRIMEEFSLPEQTVIISEGYHVYRGQRIARRNGLSAAAVSSFSEETWYILPSNVVREIIAVTYDYLVSLSLAPE